MNDKKLIFPFAGIAFLISHLAVLYSMLYNLFYSFNYGLEGLYDFMSFVGLFWISHLLPPLFLGIILLTRTRSIWLQIGIAAQLFVLCDYVYFFFIENNINVVLNENLYPVMSFISFSILNIGIFLLVIYTFIFSIVCKRQETSAHTRFMLIIWFVVFAVYIACIIIYAILHTFDFTAFTLYIPYSVSWVLLALWIAFPYKKRTNFNNYPYANQQFSGSAYQETYYNDLNNNQTQPYQQNDYQYNQQQQQSPQQFSDSPYINPFYNKPKTCPYCGAPLKDGDVFCGKCGTKCG